MTDRRDDGPLAPRRPLGKSRSGARSTSSAPPAPQQQSPSQAVPSEGRGRPADQSQVRAYQQPRQPEQRTDRAEQTDQGATQQIFAPEAAPARAGAPRQGPAAPPGWRTAEASAAAADQPAATQGATATARTDDGRGRSAGSRTRTVRRAKLRLLRLDPWSVTKVSFMLSIAFGIMCVVAVFLIFSIVGASGLWDSVNSSVQVVFNQDPNEAFDIEEFVATDRVMAITMLIAAINVVLVTALATLGAFIYNMAASLLGGLEVTLAEDLK